MTGARWYKRDPRATQQWLAGLSLEERGAANTIIDLIHERGGACPADSRFLAYYFDCTQRKAFVLVQQLIAKGKFALSDGMLTRSDNGKNVAEPNLSPELSGEIICDRASKSNLSPELSGEIIDTTSAKINDLSAPRARARISNSIYNSLNEDLDLEREKEPPLTPPPPKPPPKGRSAKPRCEREFAAFWRDYPRREGKGAAEKAYARALARAGPDEILAGVARYRDRIERDGTEKRFVAHPATWLNQDRWMDEETDIGRPNGSGDWSARAEIVTAALPWMADLPTERDIAEQGRLKAKPARPPADLLRLPGRRDGLPDGREP